MAHARSSDDEVMQQLLKTHALQIAHEKCLFQSELLYGEEKERQLRLKLLLLEDDNDELQEQLSVEDRRNGDLETSIEDVQSRLRAMENDVERLRGELRMKNRELDTLKAELNSLQEVSMDSTKLLTEKLSLSRELACLGPELEHLKSQAAAHQSILAEKLSLQRQLSTTQVELENEKRATQRALSREEGKQNLDSELEAQVDSLQAELAKERRERQKAEREAQKVTADFDGKKTILDSRLDAFRNKLRMTKEQLKESQEELQAARASAKAQNVVNNGTEAIHVTARNPRKRSLAQLDTDAAIGTPGILPAAKKSKRGSTVPGDKSTFSITPFLNRTMSIAPESPPTVQPTIEIGQEDAEDDDVEAAASPTRDMTPSAEPAKKNVKNNGSKEPKKTAATNKPAVLVAAKAAKSNNKTVAGRKAKITPALEQVREEDNDENVPPANQGSIPPDEHVTKPKKIELNDRASEEPTFIKKKRKLLGGGLAKTLFDDDDGDTGKGSDRGLFGGARAFGSFARPLGSVKLGGRPGSSASAFGAFSPLKKDKKSIGA
ncbi:hypothetical protein MMC26_005010 [Xylographa opegraphella]|nr:hypothetical protein [Xylographa opegraphella]